MRTKLAIALATVYVVWGSTYLAIAVADRSLPPFLMLSVRFLLAGALTAAQYFDGDAAEELEIRRLADALDTPAEELVLLAKKLPAEFEQDLLARPEQQVAALYRSMAGKRYTEEEWREVLRLLREQGES